MKKIFAAVTVMAIIVLFAPSAPVFAGDIAMKVGYQSLAGYKAGFSYSLNLGNNLSLQPELMFSQKKYEYIPYYGYIIPEKKLRDRVQYIEIPVLLKYRVIPDGRTCPTLFFGGYVAFRTNRKSYLDDPEIGYPYRKYSDVDTGIILGVGFDHKEGKTTWIFDIRANLGFGWVQKIEQNHLSSFNFEPEKNNTKSISAMIGIGF
jgi:hypothetical protein